jgi:hypothetical protein
VSLAETAVLAVEMNLTGNLSKGLSAAKTELGKVDQAVAGATTRAASGFGKLGSAGQKSFGIIKSGAEKAREPLAHFGETVSGLLGPLGIVGLGGAALGLGAALERSTAKASDMGFAIEKLTALTGESASQISSLAFVTEKYGIDATQFSQIVGFTEKTLGKLSETTAKTGKAAKSAALQHLELVKAQDQARGASVKEIDKLISEQKAHDAIVAAAAGHAAALNKLQALQKQYGVTLTDASGKALSFSQILNNVADFYTGNAAASTKAALAATVFGRGYAKLIPVLALGSKGIRDAEQAAQSLGLTLTDQNVKDLSQFREATREAGEAIGGLQLQIGLVAIPAIKDLANAISSFLAHGGRDQIVGFFKSAVQFAQSFAGVITGTVIPTVKGLADAALGFWNTIPQPLRDLLVKGFIADRTIRFLFGVSPIHIVASLAETAIGKVVGALAGAIGPQIAAAVIGKEAFIQKVFVVNEGFGGLGNAAGAAEGAAAGEAGAAEGAAAGGGLLSKVGTVAKFVVPVAIAAVAIDAAKTLTDAIDPGLAAALNDPTGAHGTPLANRDPRRFNNNGQVVTNLAPAATPSASTGAPTSVSLDHPTLDKMAGLFNRTGSVTLDHPTLDAMAGLFRPLGYKIDKEVLRTDAVVRAIQLGLKPKDIRDALKGVTDRIIDQGKGNVAQTQRVIDALKRDLVATHDPKLHAALEKALKAVEAKLPSREFVAHEYASADKIVRSTESTSQKVKDLQAIERDLKDRKLGLAAQQIQHRIDVLKGDAVSASNRTTAAVKAKKESVSVTVTQSNKVVINSRAITKANVDYRSYFSYGSGVGDGRQG